MFHWARLVALIGTSPFGVAMYFVSEAAGPIRMANLFTFFASVISVSQCDACVCSAAASVDRVAASSSPGEAFTVWHRGLYRRAESRTPLCCNILPSSRPLLIDSFGCFKITLKYNISIIICYNSDPRITQRAQCEYPRACVRLDSSTCSSPTYCVL